MGIFKKIWSWLFGKKEVESYEDYKARKIKEAFEKKHSRGGEGTKIKGGVNQAPTTARPNFTPPPQNPPRDFKRGADEFLRQQAGRNLDDNFLTGAMVGYVVADDLNENKSHRNVEETKSNDYESRCTPSSSSSYDSGSYSSSYDSGSSSSSCDSGC